MFIYFDFISLNSWWLLLDKHIWYALCNNNNSNGFLADDHYES